MKENVLIVDDDHSILYVFKLCLEDQGYVVNTDENGIMACELANKIKFDVIVLDLVLPDISGFDVFENIRESGQSTCAKIMLLTGNTTAVVFSSAKKQGFDKCLEKPISTKDFIFEIANLMK